MGFLLLRNPYPIEEMHLEAVCYGKKTDHTWGITAHTQFLPGSDLNLIINILDASLLSRSP
jgi:hypothetical protein